MSVMSDVTIPADPASCERDKSYLCEKRMFRSFMTALAALIVFQTPGATVFCYVMGAIFWDWWLYSYKGYKESDNMPEWYFSFKKMTPYQVTKYSSVTV